MRNQTVTARYCENQARPGRSEKPLCARGTCDPMAIDDHSKGNWGTQRFWRSHQGRCKQPAPRCDRRESWFVRASDSGQRGQTVNLSDLSFGVGVFILLDLGRGEYGRKSSVIRNRVPRQVAERCRHQIVGEVALMVRYVRQPDTGFAATQSAGAHVA